ncbi:hypothetical protein ACO2Q3_09700 [Caulobacter sp. KR2-114]|uniref:hypothetical protein n=1 Tax=Caulobacter sp. KR2-114 TaxID=3400912 RepID=UPI003BFD2E1D
MTDATGTERSRESESENQRPDRAGHPPRPATEPKGAEWSTQTPKTETDPGTGEPTKGK